MEVDRKSFPPLQAADILAFEGWKQWARQHGGDTRRTRYPFKRLSESVPSEWATLKPMSLNELWASNELTLPPLLTAVDFVVGRTPQAPLTLPSWG